MSDDVLLLQEWEGRIVPRAFSVGYIVLSYLVSYVGTWTTLELIHRRTGGRGTYNWSLLFGSSISMGGIAIWCMHFIGNRAIVLAGGQTVIQIAYSPGFTTLSFFVPILVLLTAFTVLGSDDRVSLFRVTVGGTLSGLAICGMHYLGQAGISNYISVYSVGNVVGSAVVAVVASIVALSVFFVLRATWTNSWWKRALCAIILAGAVFGMHWLASVGTQYRLKHVDPSSSYNFSRNWIVILVIILSIAACFILIIFTMLAQRRRSRSANRAQQVVLACATFDRHGRVMVTPEGLLPNQKVTNSYVERSLDDVFGISHPVFHWIFRVTRNWSSISGLLPSMRKHLYQTSTLRPESNSEVNLNSDEDKPTEDYSIIFRELFCIAAADLAEHLGEPLENMGILSDEIFNTGQTAASVSEAERRMAKSSVDLERDDIVTPTPGRGQLLFLIRRVDRKAAERLSASGYRFAEIQNVVRIIGRSMQINHNALQARLSNMFEYADETHILKPGVHLAFFAVRARVRGGFEVLVRKDASSQLPTMQLRLDSLSNWNLEFLSQLDGWSVKACLKFLTAKSCSSKFLNKEQTFAKQLHDALRALEEEINDPLFADALLIATPVSAPCGGVSEDAGPGQATLIAFRLMLPIQFRARGPKLEFTPLSFFRIQQQVYRNSLDHAIFARKIHREFGSVLNHGRLSIEGQKKSRPKFLGNPIRGLKSKSTLNVGGPSGVSIEKPRVNSDADSEIKLVENQTFGGIMVSHEVSVDVKDLGDGSSGRESSDGLDGIEMTKIQYAQMGTRGTATKEAEDQVSYVDILFSACTEAR